MTRTYRHKSMKEKKTYVGWNHNKRWDHEARYAVDDPRPNHTFDRGRSEGSSRKAW